MLVDMKRTFTIPLLMIIALVGLSSINCCCAYVLASTATEASANRFALKKIAFLEELASSSSSPSPSSMLSKEVTADSKSHLHHIQKVIHPSEIREPKNLAEITSFINLSKSEKLIEQQQAKTNEHRKNKEEESATISYSDLFQLLAKWQLSNEKNYYAPLDQMQMETTQDIDGVNENDSGDIYEMSGNF